MTIVPGPVPGPVPSPVPGPSARTPDPHQDRVGETPVERACKLLSEAALVTMLVVIGIDVVTRSIFNFSFEVSDEIGGYMLVAITFLSLAVCQVNNSFHHVELVQARLPARVRALSRAVFDLMSLCVCALLFWQFVRLELSSWRSGDLAPTYLATPLWLPRLAMAIGAGALCVSVTRTLVGHLRRAAGREPAV